MKSILLFLLLFSSNGETQWLNTFLNSDEFKQVIPGIDFDSEVTLYIEAEITVDFDSAEYKIVRFEHGDYRFFSQNFAEKNKNTLAIYKNVNYDKAWSFFRPYSGSVKTYVLDDDFGVKQVLIGAF